MLIRDPAGKISGVLKVSAAKMNSRGDDSP